MGEIGSSESIFEDSAKSLRTTYDSEANAAYIYLADATPRAAGDTYVCEGLPQTVKGEINLDFDSDGRLLGIEILDADKVLPEKFTRKEG